MTRPLDHQICAVLVARWPRPGRVKSRLVADGLDPNAAADIAMAMLRCTAARLRRHFTTLVLAVDDPPSPSQISSDCGVAFDGIIAQGSGDLGERLVRIWRTLGEQRALAFFGADSPDLPDAHLEAIAPALDSHECAVGRTVDGGYWTLAARSLAPAIFEGIDWGTAYVYDQTLQRAAEVGLSIASLPEWMDVDHADQLEDLMRRLRDRFPEGAAACDAQPLWRLQGDLARITSSPPEKHVP